jgi:hypothetical protein
MAPAARIRDPAGSLAPYLRTGAVPRHRRTVPPGWARGKEVLMLRRVMLGASAATLALALSATIALAGNPAGTGQPSAGCGDENATVMPNGFTTGGFANAEARYANPDSTGGTASGNWHVVSQYDVACYQLTQH